MHECRISSWESAGNCPDVGVWIQGHWLCRVGELNGKGLVGFTGPCGWSGTLGPPGHGIGIERGHEVLVIDPKKAAEEEEEGASPGWGLGTPASSRSKCKDLGGGSP